VDDYNINVVVCCLVVHVRTLHAKDSFLITDRIWHFIHLHFFKDQKSCISSRIAAFQSSSMLAVIVAASITIPKNVSLVVSVTTFSGLIGAMIC